MAVHALASVKARQGRFSEVVKILKEAESVFEKIGGAKSVHLLRPTIGAGETTFVLTTTHDDWSDFGSWVDKLRNNSEYRALFERGIDNTDPAIESWNNMVLTDMD